jgi:hypothetical protein
MRRPLRYLSLMLLALALLAPAATADQFTFHNTETGQHQGGQLSATQVTNHAISAGGGFGAISCTTATLSGSAAFGTEGSLTLTPSYSGCKDSLGRTVDASAGGCAYIFDLGVTIGKSDTYPSEGLEVECPKEKSMVFTVTNGSGTAVCTMTVGAQTGSSFVTFTLNTANNDITIDFNVLELVNTTSGGFLNCGISNGTHDGTYEGTSTLTAQTIFSEALDASIESSF